MAVPIPTKQARFGQEEALLKTRAQDGVDAVALDRKSVWRFIEDIGWVQLAGPGTFNPIVPTTLPLSFGASAASLGKITIPANSLGPRGYVHARLLGMIGPVPLTSDFVVTSISPGETRSQTINLIPTAAAFSWSYEAIFQNKSEAGGGNQNTSYHLTAAAGGDIFDTAQVTNDTTRDWTLEFRASIQNPPASVVQALVEVRYAS